MRERVCVCVIMIVIMIVIVHVITGMCAIFATSAFVFENKEALNYLGICDVVGERARTDVCLHVNAGHVYVFCGNELFFFFLLLLFFSFFFRCLCAYAPCKFFLK